RRASRRCRAQTSSRRRSSSRPAQPVGGHAPHYLRAMTDRTRRALAVGTFIALAIAFLAASHGYLARRLVLDPGWPEPARSLGVAAIVLFAALIALGPIGGAGRPRGGGAG